MSGPQRAPDQTGISVSMAKSLLSQIDARAAKLGLTRSQYFAHLARNDLAEGGGLMIQEETSHPKSLPDARENAGSPKPISYLKTKRK